VLNGLVPLLRRVMPAWTLVAVVACSTLAVLLSVELVATVVSAIALRANPPEPPPLRSYGRDRLRQVYPDFSEQQMLDILGEVWRRPLAFEPFTQFKESPYTGRYVNVTAAGFRGNGAGATPPWPPDDKALNIFVFGGSTTFGYGLPDDQTIVARLGEALPGRPALYNFGRGNYFSSQERVLFEQLLLDGHTPDIAIFIDGLNEFLHLDGAPSGSERLERAYETPSIAGQAFDLVSRMRVVRTLRRWRLAVSAPNRPRGDVGRDVLAAVATRYLENKAIVEAIAAKRGIRTVFVWQPVPSYKYDETYHLFKEANYGRFAPTKPGYALMAERLVDAPPDDALLWLADSQEHRKEPLYVDQVHYTGRFAKTLAEAIAEFIVRTGRL
jgi:hypothetical protein